MKLLEAGREPGSGPVSVGLSARAHADLERGKWPVDLKNLLQEKQQGNRLQQVRVSMSPQSTNLHLFWQHARPLLMRPRALWLGSPGAQGSVPLHCRLTAGATACLLSATPPCTVWEEGPSPTASAQRDGTLAFPGCTGSHSAECCANAQILGTDCQLFCLGFKSQLSCLSAEWPQPSLPVSTHVRSPSFWRHRKAAG